MKIKPPSFRKAAICLLLISVLFSLVLLSSNEKRYFEVDIGDIAISTYVKETSTNFTSSRTSDITSVSSNIISSSSNKSPQTSEITINNTNITENKNSSSEKSATLTPPKSNLPAEIIYKASTDKYKENLYIDASGIESTNNGLAHTSLIQVEAGKTYYFKPYTSYSMYAAVVIYDSNKRAIRGYHPNNITQLDKSYCYAANYFGANNYEKECNWITIPQGVSYISFNIPKSEIKSFEVYKNNFPEEVNTYTSTLSYPNKLKNNSVVFLGDSIGAGFSAKCSESFAEHIAGANNMKYRNFSMGGKNLTYHSSIMTNETFKSIVRGFTKNDCVIIEGFANDIVNNSVTPLGTITPKGTTEFDSTTFIGLLEKTIYDYQQAGYKAKLGFVLTAVSPARDKSIQRKYWDAAISVFKKYNVNYVDLYSETYLLSDTIHPNSQGQLAMAKDIEIWMNTF